MSPASIEDLLARYAEINRLIERALAACQARDTATAALLGHAVTQKLRTIDERLLELAILPEEL